HAGGAVAAVPARRAVFAGRFPFGRIERPDAIPLRRRPRQCAGFRAIRPALGAGDARAQGHSRQGSQTRKTGDAVRRARLAADRRAGARHSRLPLAVALAFGGRPGQGHAARTRLPQGRGGDFAASGKADRQRFHAQQAGKFRRGGRLAAMSALPQQKLDALLDRHGLVERELASGLAADAYVKLSREFAELSPVVEAIKAYRAVGREIGDLDALMADGSTDAEMRRMAQSEKQVLQSRQDKLEHQLKLALIPKDAMDDHDAILEIRAGTGGDEAALFAGDLF